MEKNMENQMETREYRRLAGPATSESREGLCCGSSLLRLVLEILHDSLFAITACG